MSKTKASFKPIEPLEKEKASKLDSPVSSDKTNQSFIKQLFGGGKETGSETNYTPITNSTDQLSEQQQIDRIRGEIQAEQHKEQQKKQAEIKQFEYVKHESEKAIEERKRREYQRKKQQVEEERTKIEEEKNKKQLRPPEEPRGKVRRSIFSIGKPKKTSETRVGFGKQ